MSNKQQEARTIHSQILNRFPLESILALLEVAKDLRSGKIPPEKFDMSHFWGDCGTTHCIAGWAMVKLGHSCLSSKGFYKVFPNGGGMLFWAGNPSDPQLAADAIERYIYENSSDPWLFDPIR